MCAPSFLIKAIVGICAPYLQYLNVWLRFWVYIEVTICITNVTRPRNFSKIIMRFKNVRPFISDKIYF